MTDFTSTDEALEQLIQITEILLGPDGCPWDRSREPDDVKTSLLEETYEVMEAIDQDDPNSLVEELGDLLYQIVFLTQLYENRPEICLLNVLNAIIDKLVRRHPHVFGDEKAETPEEGISKWKDAKRRENKSNGPGEERQKQERSTLSGIPRELPALLKTYRLTQKAASAGFDWNERGAALDKVKEEVDELSNELNGDREEDQTENIRSELGDLLFACANLARKLDMDPEMVLQDGNQKFVSRFRQIERDLRREGESVETSDQQELIERWQELE